MSDTLLTSEVRKARERLSLLARWYTARPRGTSPAELDAIVAADEELERVSRTARIETGCVQGKKEAVGLDQDL